LAEIDELVVQSSGVVVRRSDGSQRGENGSTTEGGYNKEAEAEAEADIKEQFMCFWEKYPNKKGKADSLKWWKRIKPDAELLQLMLAAVAAQQRERQAYAALGLWHADWPHGDVWLKHERWQDEIVMPTAAPSAIPPARNDVRVSEVR